MRNQVVTPDDGIAWVTGASSGIGYYTALELARNGWTVAATARRESELRALADAAENFPGQILPYPGDTTDPNRMLVTVTQAEVAFAPIALAVLNAGIYIPVNVPDLDLEAFDQSWLVNVMGTVHALNVLLPKMIERRKGHVAIVSSVAGYGGLPSAAAYGATKAALQNLAETLKIELDRHNVRVSIVNPGFVRSPGKERQTFPRPLMISPKDAAHRLVVGLKSQRFEMSFPKRFTWMLRVLKCFPRDWYIYLVKRQTGWHKKPADPARSLAKGRQRAKIGSSSSP